MNTGTLEARDVRLVVAIVEGGGATGAAKRLHLSQSAVSHQLRGLEERLGVKLFERLGKRLQVTDEGRRVAELGRQVLEPLLQLELELKRSAVQQRRKLRVGAQCGTAYHWLPKVLKTLMAEHPDVDLKLHGDVVGDARTVLTSGELDLVLSVSPPPSGGFGQLPLFRDELVLVVPRGHELSHRKYVVGSDLADQTLILGHTSPSERTRVAQRLGAGPARVVHVPATEAVFELVHAGMGVTIQPSFTLNGRSARDGLIKVRLTRTGIQRNWAGVFRRNSALTAPIVTLIDALKQTTTATPD